MEDKLSELAPQILTRRNWWSAACCQKGGGGRCWGTREGGALRSPEHTLVEEVEGGLEVFVALIYFCYSVCLNIVKINARAEAEASFRFGHRDTNVPPPVRRAGCSRKPTLFPLFIHLCDTPTPKPPSLFHHLWPPTKLRFGSFDVNQLARFVGCSLGRLMKPEVPT